MAAPFAVFVMIDGSSSDPRGGGFRRRLIVVSGIMKADAAFYPSMIDFGLYRNCDIER